MSMSDPIADLLTRIRNASAARHSKVDVPASKLKVEVCRVLKEEGFIEDYIVSDEPKPGLIRVSLKYTEARNPVVQGLRRVSRPSFRVMVPYGNIKQVRSGLGITILTTSKGVMTGKHARQNKVGGEVLCEVW